jgi:hypothetical protein
VLPGQAAGPLRDGMCPKRQCHAATPSAKPAERERVLSDRDLYAYRLGARDLDIDPILG